MSTPNFGFLVNNDLPSCEVIMAMCEEAGYERTGIPLRNEPFGPIIAWVKYAPTVDMAEALTQDWVAQYLGASGEASVRVPRVHMAFVINPGSFHSMGYIIMEYIDAPDCDKKDVQLVARAVQTLISIPGPNFAPGPVGGGPIIHAFFVDWVSTITYDTVEELQSHVNGILRRKGDTRRVDLVADSRDGLRLCPCDINPGNFKKCEDGTVVALDFHVTCFLPPSFFAVAMVKSVEKFAWKVSRLVNYPKPDDVDPILTASYFLVPYGTNNIGIPEDILQRKGPTYQRIL